MITLDKISRLMAIYKQMGYKNLVFGFGKDEMDFLSSLTYFGAKQGFSIKNKLEFYGCKIEEINKQSRFEIKGEK